jgi:hypothetical protein
VTAPHPLAAVLAAAAAGRFPTADGATELTAPDSAGTRAAVAFSGHAFVLADVDPVELSARLAAADGAGGGFGGVHHPTVLSLLADTGGPWRTGTLDVVLVRRGRDDCDDTVAPVTLVRRDDLSAHPRVARALAHRRDVVVLADEVGLVSFGRGLVDRWEVSVELFDAESAPPGAGRRLLAGAWNARPSDEPLWAQVAAGNARSLRAFLAAGFVPVASEVLLVRDG